MSHVPQFIGDKVPRDEGRTVRTFGRLKSQRWLQGILGDGVLSAVTMEAILLHKRQPDGRCRITL